MSTTIGKAGAVIRPVANKRLAHGLGEISFGFGEPGGSGETAVTFLPSLKHPLGITKPHRIMVAVALVLAAGTVVISTPDPEILGVAIDLLLVGIAGKDIPMGVTKERVIEAVRSGGDDTLVKVLQCIDFAPGQSIDFGTIEPILALVLVLYVVSAVITYVSN